MSENRKPQPPIEPTTALVKLNRDPSVLQETDPTIEVPDKGQILAAALTFLAIIQPRTPEQTIRTSPVIKKGPDLISKSIQINTDGGKMESENDCEIRCGLCGQKCNRGFVHTSDIMHTCDSGHQF